MYINSLTPTPVFGRFSSHPDPPYRGFTPLHLPEGIIALPWGGTRKF
jgi:hypothetical protein